MSTPRRTGDPLPSSKALPPGGLWTPAQTAATLGVSARTLRRWRATGAGPRYVTFDRTIRYVPAVVIRYVESAQRIERSDV